MALSRRNLLVGVGLTVVGCRSKPPPTCNEETGLTAAEREVRRSLAYVDRAPEPSRACLGCSQYVVPKDSDGCGGCRLMKGGVSPAGTCKVFAPRG